ncbi:hypothetical protein S40288_11021 [Stachybotrys chartarum IBT 40288]|nr:hypothetical protein S40288_11021 [Stachybotrys chartarum IBT 40288]
MLLYYYRHGMIELRHFKEGSWGLSLEEKSSTGTTAEIEAEDVHEDARINITKPAGCYAVGEAGAWQDPTLEKNGEWEYEEQAKLSWLFDSASKASLAQWRQGQALLHLDKRMC